MFVLSGGEEWWPKTAVVEGASWRVENCQIGNEKPGRDRYKIVAIAGVARVDMGKHGRVLPKGERTSQTVTVQRK